MHSIHFLTLIYSQFHSISNRRVLNIFKQLKSHIDVLNQLMVFPHKTYYLAVGNLSSITTELSANAFGYYYVTSITKAAIISTQRLLIDDNHEKIINDALTRISYPWATVLIGCPLTCCRRIEKNHTAQSPPHIFSLGFLSC